MDRAHTQHAEADTCMLPTAHHTVLSVVPLHAAAVVTNLASGPVRSPFPAVVVAKPKAAVPETILSLSSLAFSLFFLTSSLQWTNPAHSPSPSSSHATPAGYKAHLKPTEAARRRISSLLADRLAPASACLRALLCVVVAGRARDGRERRRRVLAGGGDGVPQRDRGGHGLPRQGRHERRAGPAGARDPPAAHRRLLPRPHRLLPRGQGAAQDDAGDLRLPLRQRGAGGGAAAVHDLRGAAVHHGHLRHRLLQRGAGPHLPARRRHAVRVAEPPLVHRRRQARRHARVARGRHGAHLLPRRAPHPRPPQPAPLLCSVAGVGCRRRPRRREEVDAGHGGDPGQLRVPLLLVPAARPARPQVPLRLLLQCLHVHLQLPPGRRRRPLRPPQPRPRRLARHLQVPDPHHPLRRYGGVRRVVRAADVVHREAGAGVRRRLHSGGADHRLRHGLHRAARDALPRKCAGISVGDRWAVPAAVGQEAGGPAAASKSCRG